MPHGTTKVDYPVIVIGGGAAGLNAAIALGFEGIPSLVVETGALGGQAATSHHIENIPGFPKGISGPELTRLMILQGLGVGVQYLSPFRAERVVYDEQSCIFTLIGDDHQRLTARAILIASGVQNRLIPAINATLYYGTGLYYGSPAQNKALWARTTTAVIGSGNAAAQAAMFLSDCDGAQVHLIVRGKALKDSMSDRVIRHLHEAPNVNVMLESEVVEILGDDLILKGARVKGPNGMGTVDFQACHVHIGQRPRTAWLDGCVALDENGYAIADEHLQSGMWRGAERSPLVHETSHPGIFVAGTARRGHTLIRVNTAHADGVIATSGILKYLDLNCSLQKVAPAAMVS